MKIRYYATVFLLSLATFALTSRVSDAQNAIAIQGLESNNEGTAAWNANGAGPEPAATGHAVSWTGCVANAYHYLASRDYVDPTATHAVHGTGIAGFPMFSMALSDGGYTIDDFTIAHGLLTLGDDIEEEDWEYDASTRIETRYYTGTTTMEMRLGDEPMATAPFLRVTIIIEYNDLSNCFDDRIYGFSDYALPDDDSGTSSPAVQQAAAAFILDVGANGVRFDFDSIQAAAQLDFVAEGRSGAFFDAQGEQEVGDGPLPVELTAFDAVVDGSDVLLSWTTASETNNAGFYVMRNTGCETGQACPWEELGFIDGQGTTLETQRYAHRINGLTAGTYRFRLKQIDYDGTFDYSPEVEVRVVLDAVHRLTAPYPNPFTAETQFSLMVARRQQVEIAVYDVLGRQIQVLHNGEMSDQQARSFVLDADALPSGIYMIRVAGERFMDTRRVVLLK